MQTLGAEIEAISREKDPHVQILQLYRVVEVALPEIIANTDKSSQTSMLAALNTMGTVVLPMIGIGLGGPVAAVAGTTMGVATWSVLSAAVRAGVIPEEMVGMH